MSFSLSVKEELLNNKPMRMRNKDAQAYGLFLFGRSFSPQEISLHTENTEIVQLFRWFVKEILGNSARLANREWRRAGKTVHSISLAEETDRLRLLAYFSHGESINPTLLASSEPLGAFFAGAYLACGNMADPQKRNHLEFVLRDVRLCEELAALLEQAAPGAKISQRRAKWIVYYKEYAPMEDLLAMMGATKSCLALIDIETYKSVRNQANRATNCETANIDKLVSAATSQVSDICLLFQTKGEAGLPESLLDVARLRLENPEASLRELAELSPEPLSRSGIHHRLDKLSKMAAEIREQEKGGNADE